MDLEKKASWILYVVSYVIHVIEVSNLYIAFLTEWVTKSKHLGKPSRTKICPHLNLQRVMSELLLRVLL